MPKGDTVSSWFQTFFHLILNLILNIFIAKATSIDSSCFLYQISDQTEGYGADWQGGPSDQPGPS